MKQIITPTIAILMSFLFLFAEVRNIEISEVKGVWGGAEARR
jgi:hypothetical protein